MIQDRMFPTRVVASASAGIATGEPYNCVPETEDTITLLVDWQSRTSARHRATACVDSISSHRTALTRRPHQCVHRVVDRAAHVRVRRALGPALVLHGGEGAEPRRRRRAAPRLSALQGEINVDQAHRGYDVVSDEVGRNFYNPF
jgi:D-galacturonate reductase